MSWIHDTDLVRSVEWLIEHGDIEGPVNFAAPEPVPQAEFMRELRRAVGMPLGIPATAWMIEAAACVLRTDSELILKSRRIVPGRLLEHGFEFEFAEWTSAAGELVSRHRSRSAP